MKRLALLASLAIALGGCVIGASSAPAPPPPSHLVWRAPGDPMTLARRARLVPERFEHLAYHVHAHLDVFLQGQGVRVPAGIGINIHDPGVQRFQTDVGTAYGGIKMCVSPCISPLHTHDATGILHTESSTPRPNTLGQFFVEWNVRLTTSCVGNYCRPRTKITIYVDGKRYSGDPNRIGLANHREIAVVIGTPPKHIPSSYDFSNL